MRDGEDSFDAPGEDLPPSKSEIKRRMLALQELGEALVALNDKQLARIPVEDDRLSEAIREARAIRSNSARQGVLPPAGTAEGRDP
jgi:ribosome-associated protein